MAVTHELTAVSLVGACLLIVSAWLAWGAAAALGSVGFVLLFGGAVSSIEYRINQLRAEIAKGNQQ